MLATPSPRFALFDTPLGPCGIAWSEQGITSLYLPETTPDATRERIRARAGKGAVEADPPAWVREATLRIARHFDGKGHLDDLRDVRLDLRGVSPFFAKVYEASRAVEAGSTIGYGELAKRAGGSVGASRAVGQAMAKNPFPIVVPCHRVLAAGGKPGGFSAPGGNETKRKMLALEGVTLVTAAEEPAQRSLFKGDDPTSFDPDEAVRALTTADRRLARVIEKVGPLRLQVHAMHTPFQALAQSIVYQQLTGKVAATILGRVHAIYGGRRAFTAPAVLDSKDEPLRMAGLSRAKTAALKDLAAKTLDGTVPTMRALGRMPDDAIVERLTTIRGIGRWTVEMLLIFRLGRPDVLPIDDYGVRKGLMRVLGTKEMPSRTALAERGERWRPYRSAASWYLWRACELP
jgi:methylated-DNA-[protein]-cysteine S-methyltransferase